MTCNFIRYDQDQQHLLPKDLSEWVAEDSLEQFVSDTIDYLDDQNRLEPFFPEETDENRGRPQFHPVMLLKVLVFVYAQGIRSSRNIDRLLESLHQQRTSQECNHYETVDSGRRQQEIESPHFSARI